ncbi:MAG TPA: polynucleotide kinase-phosphatase [Thermoanaerobaculia bacterium]|nr:polynucleotide kinase-phosphatase [Thermoanaerobaculia bacterium]
MNLALPELALVVLVGPSGSGKSTFARRHFKPTEILTSDFCRALVSDDENDQSATTDAFAVLHFIAGRRLARGLLTVVDATNVQPEARKPLVELAREHNVLPVAIVFDLPGEILEERSRTRTDRNLGAHVVRNQRSHLRRSLRDLQREGFRHVWTLRSPEEVDAVAVERRPLWPDRRSDHGPFDLIGDIHGCGDELEELLGKLGYAPDPDGVRRHQQGRKVVFLGDLVDRGPRVPAVLRTVMSMVEGGSALCVPGNHDQKLLRWLRGKRVTISHGLERSVEQLEEESPDFRVRVAAFLDGLVSHYVLDGGRLVAAHAGMKQEMQGRASGRVRDFALYGETTGEVDELGLPVRLDWAAEYRGPAMVVYGHTPVAEPRWLNRTINVDTGCVFGGALTALRYPELELVSVPAREVYAGTPRDFRTPAASLTPQQEHDDVLDLEDVTGKRIIHTRLRNDVTIREENAAAALEAMSRFAVDPKWLVYLPPTMSPSETSRRPDLLEHPAEAFAYFRAEGVERAVCEEKHMGSRAVLVVCRDADEARRRFGIVEKEASKAPREGDEGIGTCVTRTGRRFFDDPALERALLLRVREALDRSGLWERLDTGWVCLDAELMPWSVKAQELIREQYASVGAAARIALPKAVARLAETGARGIDTGELLARYRQRYELSKQFADAYRRYCWPVASVADLRLAPFHLLASEGAVHIDKDHVWQMETLAEVCRADPELLVATPYRVVDLADPASEAAATDWWEELTGKGGEGMVVKPFDFVARGRRGFAQPALKCRGREYLRIIYGPEYTLPDNLERLRQRGLGAKRSLALREFALGVEGLERFVNREPLRRVHECVFGVLALESEPVDPRL